MWLSTLYIRPQNTAARGAIKPDDRAVLLRPHAEDIADLAEAMLRDPARVAVTPVAVTVERVTAHHHSFFGQARLLAQLLRPSLSTQHWVFTAPSIAPTRS